MSKLVKLMTSITIMILFIGCTGEDKQPNSMKSKTFYRELKAEPSSLNPFSSTDLYARYVHGYVLDTLLTRDEDTYKWKPLLAKAWNQSKDGKEISFTLREGIKFHNDEELTAEDVKFSFDAIKNPDYKAASLMPYYENISEAIIKGKYEITFKIKKKYFGNLNVLGSLSVVPKSFYGDPKKRANKVIVGSGPYKLHKYNRGRNILLKKNLDWFGYQLEEFKKFNKFEIIFFRFVKDDNIALEMIKKGELDYIKELPPELFVKKAVGSPWGETAIKQKVENLTPKRYRYIGFNQKIDIFKSKKVRFALTHLMNRELMIEKFRYNMDLPATGPWYQQSPYASKKMKAIEFNPKKASQLLKAEGWADTDSNGILDKIIKGKKVEFKFTLINSNQMYEKYFTLYKQDLKKAGIQMDLKLVDWNSLIQLLDEKKFEAVTLGWGGGSVDNDPKQIWHSTSSKQGGSNYISYNNPEVDRLIDEGRAELDKKKRIKLYQTIYEKIAADAPYIFMFNSKYQLYAHTSRMKFDQPTHKYAVGIDAWSMTK